MSSRVPFFNISDWLVYWLSQSRLPACEQATLERYYTSYFNFFGTYLQHHYANQIREIETLVSAHEKPRVLEIGCGCGTETIWLGFCGASVVGIDLQEERMNTAEARLQYVRDHLYLYPDVEFKLISVFQAADLGKFDIIWMEQTFHHIEPRDRFLDLLADLLKPGGYVVISDANAWNPLLQLQLFRQRGFKTIRNYRDKDGIIQAYGNERITTPFNLCTQLKRKGFTIESLRYFRVFPNRAWADRLAWFESLVPAWLRPAFTHYNLVARLK